MSKSEIMTILLYYHFDSFRNFKHYYLFFTKVLYGKVFADMGYIKQEFFENLFNQGIHLVHGLKSNMKKQAYTLVEQDDAAQAIYNRMHQRTAQEQGQPCSFTPSLRT